MQSHQSETVLHDGVWNVFEQGSGQPIVFLHNGGGTLWNWAYQLEHFSPNHRVIAPDLPGFGRSHRSSTPLTLDHYVEGLLDLFEVFNCFKPILVGNCIGASIALEFALRYPEKVNTLALFNICGGGPMLNPHLQFWANLQPRTTMGKVLHRSLVNATSHPNVQELNAPFLYGNGKPLLHPMIQQVIEHERLNPKLRASLYSLVLGLDSFSIFSIPRQKPDHFPPVLLGWGAQNKILAPAWAEIIAKWLKPDHFWLIEKAGHMPMYEQSEQMNQVLDHFFQEHAELDPMD